MAERDTTPVTVTLNRQRPYRANDTDREAVWVGPGEVQVPRWVADEWKMPAETEGDEQPPVVVETVKAEPLKTVETVKVVDDARQSKSKDK